jgi:hypothetical protein
LPHGSPSIACTTIAKIFQQGRKIQLDLACQQTEKTVSCYISNVCMVVILTSVALAHGHKKDATKSRMLPGPYGSMRKMLTTQLRKLKSDN